MQKFSGNGMLFLEIDGSTMAYDLAAGQSLLVDTGNLAAMEATCSIDVQTVKGIGNVLLGGEGLFNTRVTGPGRIWLQTMPISNMAGAMALGSCRRRSNGSSPQISRKNTTAAPEDLPFRCGCFYRSCILNLY